MQAASRHRSRLSIGAGLILLITSPLAAQTLLGQPGTVQPGGSQPGQPPGYVAPGAPPPGFTRPGATPPGFTQPAAPPVPFTLPPSVTGIPAAPPQAPPQAQLPAQAPASPARAAQPAASTDPNQPALTSPRPPATWQPRQVAELVALDKVSARPQPIQLRVGQTATFNSLSITLKSCAGRPPDQAPDSAGFLEIKDSHPGAQGFTGWMIASAPALNSLQHPVYDITLKSCHN